MSCDSRAFSLCFERSEISEYLYCIGQERPRVYNARSKISRARSLPVVLLPGVVVLVDSRLVHRFTSLLS